MAGATAPPWISRANERVIALVDMDCFYVQVEARDHPSIRGRPAAVVQYNTHRGGGIIAVNYEARACGVKRGMRGSEATEVCRDIQLVRVPMQRNKANLQKYRAASKEVMSVLCGYSDTLERASIDEAYLELTPTVDNIVNTWLKSMTSAAVDADEILNSTGLHDHDDEADFFQDSSEENESLNADPMTAHSNNNAGNGADNKDSIIPKLEELESTWVELPDDFLADDGYDLNDEESRREYELNETIKSDWKPRGECDDASNEMDDKKVHVETETHEILSKPGDEQQSDSVQSNVDESASVPKDDQKEKERQAALKRWLRSLQTMKPKVEPQPSTTSALCCGYSRAALNELRLSLAAKLCEEIRAAVYKETGFRCSAGIAHNKVLAKLVCGLHKPNQQTILPSCGLHKLWSNTSVHKVRNLGGKLGESLVTTFGCKTMADLGNITLAQLRSRYDDKTANWLYNIGQGEDSEEVIARQVAKSVGCGKNFLGRESLCTRLRVKEWTKTLAEELIERLEEDQLMNKRVAKTLTVSFRTGLDVSSTMSGSSNAVGYSSGTRSCPLPAYNIEKIAATALGLLAPLNTSKQSDLWCPALHHISLSASKFEDSVANNMPSIATLFQKVSERQIHDQTALELTGGQHNQTNVESIVRASEQPLPPPPPVPPKGILAYFGEEKTIKKNEKSKINVSIQSKPNESLDQSSSEDHTATANGSSFFQNFLKRKQASDSSMSIAKINCHEQSSTTASVSNERVCDDQQQLLDHSNDNYESAIDMLVDQLSSASEGELEEESRPNKQEVATDTDVYDESTDEDEKQNDTSTAITAGESSKTTDISVNNDGLSCKRVGDVAMPKSVDREEINTDIRELFPDLDAIDESVVAILPVKLQKELKEAIQNHKAKKAGKDALQKSTSGIWKYMKKGTQRQTSDHEEAQESDERVMADERGNKLQVSSDESVAAGQNNDDNEAVPGTSKMETRHTRATAQSAREIKTNRTETLKVENVLEDSDIENTPPSESKEGSVQCDKCGKCILLEDYLEHLDYHVAMDLQKEWRCGPSVGGSNVASGSKNSNDHRTKKRKSSGGENKAKKKINSSGKEKTIESFFTKR